MHCATVGNVETLSVCHMISPWPSEIFSFAPPLKTVLMNELYNSKLPVDVHEKMNTRVRGALR